MKIHFEGTHKELMRVSACLERSIDLIVMETSWISPKEGSSLYYYLDIDVVSSIPKKAEESIYDNEIYQCDKEGYDDIPDCMLFAYYDAFTEIETFINYQKVSTVEGIEHKLKELEDRIEQYRKDIENYEISAEEEKGYYYDEGWTNE